MEKTKDDVCKSLSEIINKMPNAVLQEALGISRNSVLQLRRSGTMKVDFQKMIVFLCEKGFI